jgi:nucleotide-binding universal stress UspA family protein
MYKKILLPTDGSENAEKAGKHALWLANVSGGEIIVLNIFELYYPQIAVLPLSMTPGDNEKLFEPLMEEGKTLTNNFKSKLEKSIEENNYGNIKITSMVKEGRPHQEILNTIKDEEIDLVVMGASGRHGIDRITLGSVTERVVRSAKSPVLVIN